MTDVSAGEVPRSAHASSSHAAAAVDRGRKAQPSGWWGMVLFLCSEVTLFGTLIGSYFYLNFGIPPLAAGGHQAAGDRRPAGGDGGPGGAPCR